MSKAISLALLSGVCFMAAGAATAAAAPKVRIKPASKELLLQIKEGGANGYNADTSTDAYKELDKHKYLAYNMPSRNGDMMIVALTPAGVAKADSYRAAEPANPRGPQLKPDDFEIETTPLPDFSSKRSAARQIYPFEKLDVGQSFFIPVPNHDDAAKSKQSTISAQNKKARDAFEAKPDKAEGEVAPQYRIANDTKAGVKGARVYRVA